MNKKRVRKGCASESPLPQWALHLTGLGSSPGEVMVTSVWVGSHTQNRITHSKRRKSVWFGSLSQSLCTTCSQEEASTNSTNPMWALSGRPKAWLPPRTVEDSPVPSTSWLRVPWDRKEPLSFAKNRAIV